MKISIYLKRLLPKFSRGLVVDDLEQMEKILAQVNLPVLESIARQCNGKKFRAENTAKQIKLFEQQLRGLAKGNFADVLLSAHKRLTDVLRFLRSIAEQDLGDTVFRDGITYKRVTLLQYIEAMDFFLTHTRLWLRWILVSERFYDDPSRENPSNVFTQAQQRMLEQNIGAFIESVRLVFNDRRALEEGFSSIPENLVYNDESAALVEKTTGVARLDPFSLGFFTPGTSPIYWLRMNLAEHRHKNYKKALEERTALELRLLTLDGDDSPATLNEIEYTEGRLAKLELEIKKMEERHG